MGVRDWADRHPKAVAITSSVLVLVGIGAVAVEIRGNRRTVSNSMPPHYFSVDDGQTFFTAEGSNVPPFDYKGRTAVRAYVFECEGKQFIGYLERYTPEARTAEIARTITMAQETDGRELKKPGESKWISTRDRVAVGKMLDITSPTGSSAVPMPIEP